MPNERAAPHERPEVTWEVAWDRPEDAERSWTRDATHTPHPTVPMARDLLGTIWNDEGRSVFVNGWQYNLLAPPDWPELTDEEYGERSGAQAWFEICLPVAQEIGATLRGHDYVAMSTAELVALLPQISDESSGIKRQTFRTFGRMSTEFQALVEFCARHFGEGAEVLAMDLSHGAPNETAAFGEELDRLASMARERPALASALRAGEFDELGDLEGGGEFETELALVLETAGWRAEYWDQIEKPTMAEQPALARKLIAGYIDAGDAAPRAARQRALAAAERTRDACLEQLSGEDGDELRRLVTLGQGYNAARESRAYWQLLATGLPRIPLLELGERLAQADALDRPSDIFYLRLEEAERVAAGEFPDSKRHAAELRENYAGWALLDAPPFVGVPPPPFSDDFGEMFVSLFGELVEQDSGNAVIKGIAAGKGVAEGVARVIGSLDEIERLQPGDVMICRSTAPPWTPLFGIASAVVADSGGVQSHTAIVAREFAIPCVVSTGDGTRRIADGAQVRVDGAEGTVTLL